MKKRFFPYRIVGIGGAFSDCLELHQVKDQDHVPFLLSLPAQVSLGLIKDPANGRAILTQESEVEMRRRNRSGLLAIRFDQLNPEHMTGIIRPLHMSYFGKLSQGPNSARLVALDHSEDGPFSAMVSRDDNRPDAAPSAGLFGKAFSAYTMG